MDSEKLAKVYYYYYCYYYYYYYIVSGQKWTWKIVNNWGKLMLTLIKLNILYFPVHFTGIHEI